MESLIPNNQKRFHHLDLYKGVAILLVIITHYEWTALQRQMFFFPFWIDMAVPVFMAITGYVTCYSYDRKSFSLSACYRPLEISLKYIRFIIPFFPAWILTIIARIVGNKESFSILKLLLDFISGGIGAGGYYFPVMLQIVLIMPFICFAIKKNPLKGLVICFSFNVAFEAFKTIVNMQPWLYRLCSLRYVFVLAYGSFLFFTKRKRQYYKYYYLVGFVGLIYIVLFNYLGMKPLITDYWTTTSVFAVCYIIPLMMHLIDKRDIHSTVLETIGKASYDIFLVQMVFFLHGHKIVGKYISFVPLRLLVMLILCVSVGVLYNKIEVPITNQIAKLIHGIQKDKTN